MDYFYCENITKNYKRTPVIKNITLAIKQRELVSVLGPSGVGKTTLFNVLSGLENPDSGNVYFNGKNITGTTGVLSYMHQNDLLLPFKNIIDNVTLPLIIKGVSKDNAYVRAMPLLQTFGLAAFSKHYPSQLSGGMKQRAALLRTFLDGKNFILLDEPFSALDLQTKKDMHQWLLEILKTLKLTAIFITHDIDEAINLSDTVYILSGIPGEIVNKIENVSNKDKADIKLEIVNSMVH